MRLTVLGCSGSVPGPQSPASGYLVQAGDARVVLDLGNGAFGTVQRHVGLAGLAELDAVMLSHLHADHCIDVGALYTALRYGVRAVRAVPVYAPSGAGRQLADAYASPQLGRGRWLDFREYPAGEFAVGPVTARVARVAHPVPAYAIRLEHAGRVLVYSGDTGPTPALVDLARDADMLVCEAGFDEAADNPPNLHLTGRQAGEHAAAAGVGRLVLTHVPPWGDADRAVDAAGDAFDGPVDRAELDRSWEV